jgi:hypothetical protein
MIQKRSDDPSVRDAILTTEEQAMLEELQRLAAEGHTEIPEEVLTRMDQVLLWSLDDPDSVQRALYFAARDPFYQRAVQEIEEDLAPLKAVQQEPGR